METKLNTLIIFFLFFHLAYSQTTTSTRILGIGIGTLIIIIAVIFSIVWCLACRNSSKPEVYSLLGLLVPGIIILAFALTPKESQRQVTSSITDGNFIPHIVFMVLSIVGFLIPCIFLIVNDSFAYKKAKIVARSAFVMREQENQEVDLVEESQGASGSHRELEIQSNARTQNLQH